MKRNLVAISGLALMCIAAYFIFGGEKLKYDPVVYEDGSVEYRLIYKGRDRERGTRDDQHWVLRFPKELDVIIPEPQAEFERVSPKPYAGNYNYKLRFYVNLPEFTLVKSRESYDDINLLSVVLYASEKKYGTGVYKKHTSSFSSTVDRSVNLSCRKDTEIIPGLFSLRAPNVSEKQAMYDKYGKDAQNFVKGCGMYMAKSLAKLTDYSFNDPSGRSWGTGYCRNQNVRECTFLVWLPYNRTAIYSFNHKYLTQIHDIHQGVIDLLKTATDIEKSRNISFEKD